MSYYSDQYEIRSCHVDENNHIRPTDLVKFIEESGDHQMRDRKPSYRDLFEMGKAFVVTRLSIEIYQQLNQYDKIEVRTWTCQGKGATFPRCYQVWKDGELAVSAYSEWALPDRNTGKLTKTSEIDIDHYERDEALELDIPRRYRFAKDQEFTHMQTRHVYYSDCDMNRHMNNANYFDVLWNHIPDIMNKRVTSLNMRFAHEAAFDSDIEIHMTELPLEFAKDPRASQAYGFKTTVEDQMNVECVFGVTEV